MLKDREQNRARKSKTNGLHLDFTGMIPQKNLSAPHKEKSQSKWWEGTFRKDMLFREILLGLTVSSSELVPDETAVFKPQPICDTADIASLMSNLGNIPALLF